MQWIYQHLFGVNFKWGIAILPCCWWLCLHRPSPASQYPYPYPLVLHPRLLPSRSLQHLQLGVAFCSTKAIHYCCCRCYSCCCQLLSAAPAAAAPAAAAVTRVAAPGEYWLRDQITTELIFQGI